ncbi:NAD(P) transhydrogenase, mitochondrial-like [Pezoporus occidentalis]|uniref:NAD(P) transhydrogenase, mitochondrial-like n=1 Tax=Pezoporus occidentalis TaxID=407982 RepID=UPI002F917504
MATQASSLYSSNILKLLKLFLPRKKEYFHFEQQDDLDYGAIDHVIKGILVMKGLTLTAVGGANMPVTKIPVTLAEPWVQKNFLTTVLTTVGFLTGSSGWSYSVMCCVCGHDQIFAKCRVLGGYVTASTAGRKRGEFWNLH